MDAVPRTALSRLPESGVDDLDALHSLLDEAKVGHIGLMADGFPVVIPTAIVRSGDTLLAHGSTGSRWMRPLADGADASVAVTLLDGIVLARSAFESNLHYRSAVLFGRFVALDGEAKSAGLDALIDGLVPGRSGEIRRSSKRELAATLVLELPIDRWSLKVSSSWPTDAQEDVVGDAWAGLIPARIEYGRPLTAPEVRDGIPIPDSATALGR
ncbi:MAG: putative flavin-nucleotide-binding protein [Microbacteriaceae bacterium]|nr:putative flavin-nucleotide-binding protein [Microbacteriaceae bacterium]